MFCPNCGKQIDDNSQFCGFCGFNMSKAEKPVYVQRNTPVSTHSGIVSGNKILAIILAVLIFGAGCFTGIMFSKLSNSVQMDSMPIEEQIAGRWKTVSNSMSPFPYIEFFSDGTYSAYGSNNHGTFSVSGDRIRFSRSLMSDLTYDFSYTKSNDALIIADTEFCRYVE